MNKNIKIAVAGTGYVGLSIATLLSQHHQVTAVDVIPEKVDLINSRKSPIQDEYIEKYLAEKELNLTATLDGAKAYADADFVVIAAPTNYDPVKNYFDNQPRGGSHRISEECQSPCDNGHQKHHSRGVHGKRTQKVGYGKRHLLARIPARE